MASYSTRQSHSEADYQMGRVAILNRFHDALIKQRKATINFVMSVRPHGITRLPAEGSSWYMTFEYFSKICRQNSSVTEI